MGVIFFGSIGNVGTYVCSLFLFFFGSETLTQSLRTHRFLSFPRLHMNRVMGWLRLVGSLKL